MPNKTVTIHVPIEVPEGDECGDCRRREWRDAQGYGETVCGVFGDTLIDFNKCYSCLDACEKANDLILANDKEFRADCEKLRNIVKPATHIPHLENQP